MTHHRIRTGSLCAALLTIILVASCRDQIGDPNATFGPVNWQIPTVGTTFTIWSIDSSQGNPTYRDTMPGVVTWRGSMLGKSHVMEFDSGGYFAYEDNGDISFGKRDRKLRFQIYQDWDRYPTGGGTLSRLVDSTDSLGYHTYSKFTRSFAGTETISVAGGIYSAIRIHDRSVYIYGVASMPLTDTEVQESDHWFVPEFGIPSKDVKTYSSLGKVYGFNADSLMSFVRHP
jgi:hypothetical protein